MPVASEGPLAAEIVELPPLLASVTVLPETGLLWASRSVTVIVAVLVALAVTEVGLALTVELFGLAAVAQADCAKYERAIPATPNRTNRRRKIELLLADKAAS